MFIAALFTIARTWKQPRCPSADEWIRKPVQVQCMRQGAKGWCTGMTQRDRMGREEGGRARMGNTCTPMADSCECVAKPP